MVLGGRLPVTRGKTNAFGPHPSPIIVLRMRIRTQLSGLIIFSGNDRNQTYMITGELGLPSHDPSHDTADITNVVSSQVMMHDEWALLQFTSPSYRFYAVVASNNVPAARSRLSPSSVAHLRRGAPPVS